MISSSQVIFAVGSVLLFTMYSTMHTERMTITL